MALQTELWGLLVWDVLDNTQRLFCVLIWTKGNMMFLKMKSFRKKKQHKCSMASCCMSTWQHCSSSWLVLSGPAGCRYHWTPCHQVPEVLSGFSSASQSLPEFVWTFGQKLIFKFQCVSSVFFTIPICHDIMLLTTVPRQPYFSAIVFTSRAFLRLFFSSISFCSCCSCSRRVLSSLQIVSHTNSREI